MPTYWLIIVIGTSQTPFHAGNFADVAATEMVRGSLTGSTTGTGALGTTGTFAGPAPNVQYVCVEAGTEAPTVTAPGTSTPRGKHGVGRSRR